MRAFDNKNNFYGHNNTTNSSSSTRSNNNELISSKKQNNNLASRDESDEYNLCIGQMSSSTPISDTEVEYDTVEPRGNLSLLRDDANYLKQSKKSFAILNGAQLSSSSTAIGNSPNIFSGRVPYQYKLTPEKKSHRNTSFTILNDMPPNPRSPSPVSVSSVSGRVSPFKGRGFRAGQSSRHAASSPLLTPYPLLGGTNASGVNQPTFYEYQNSTQHISSSASTTSESGDYNFASNKVKKSHRTNVVSRRRKLPNPSEVIFPNSNPIDPINSTNIHFAPNTNLKHVPLKLLAQDTNTNNEKNRKFDRLSPIISTAETSPAALNSINSNSTKAAFILLDNQENQNNDNSSRLGMNSEVPRNKLIDQQSKLKENLNKGRILSQNVKSSNLTKQRSSFLKERHSILKNPKSSNKKPETDTNVLLQPNFTVAKSSKISNSTKNLTDTKSLLTPNKSISSAKTSKSSSPKKNPKRSASKKLTKSSSTTPNNSKLTNDKNKLKTNKKFVPKSNDVTKTANSPRKNISKGDLKNRSERKTNKSKISQKSNEKRNSNDVPRTDKKEMERNQQFFRNQTNIKSPPGESDPNSNKEDQQPLLLHDITQENSNNNNFVSNRDKNRQETQEESSNNSKENNDGKIDSFVTSGLEAMTRENVDNVISVTTETVTAPLHIEAPKPQIPPESVENLLAKKVLEKPPVNDSSKSPISPTTNPQVNTQSQSDTNKTPPVESSNMADNAKNQKESNSDQKTKDSSNNKTIKSNSNENTSNAQSSSVNKSNVVTTASNNSKNDIKQQRNTQTKDDTNKISRMTNHNTTTIKNTMNNLDQVTVISEKAKPIKISVREKAAELEVQSGNINRSPSNGTLSSSLQRTVSSDVPQVSNATKENENVKKSFISRLCSCFKTPACMKCCHQKPKKSETSTKGQSCGFCNILCCRCCKKKKPTQFQPKREQITSGASSSDKNVEKTKYLGENGCCAKLRQAICCWNRKNKIKRMKSGNKRRCNFLKCCRRKKSEQSWAERRDSILSDVPSSKKSCCPKWNCWPCKKKTTVKERGIKSRSTSVLDKKKSLTPTTIQQPEKKIPVLDESLVEHTSEMKGAIPVLPIPLAWFCLILNCILPGTGTIMSGIFCLCFGKPRFSVHDGARLRIGSFIINIFVGIAQLFCVVFCLVGWGWSIWWGTIMLRVAKRHKKIKENEKLEGEQRSSFSNQNHSRGDAEHGRT